jgi:hypothetical protein
MLPDAPNQGHSGRLKLLLLHLFEVLFACCIWYLFLGRKGILVGIGAYITIHFARLFLRVFGGVPRAQPESSSDQPPTTP